VIEIVDQFVAVVVNEYAAADQEYEDAEAIARVDSVA